MVVRKNVTDTQSLTENRELKDFFAEKIVLKTT